MKDGGREDQKGQQAARTRLDRDGGAVVRVYHTMHATMRSGN